MVRIKAPQGKKIRNIINKRLYSEVICEDKDVNKYVLADSEDDPIIEKLDGVTLDERVTDLEDAVVELASIITGEE
jgi:hypothetical protein